MPNSNNVKRKKEDIRKKQTEQWTAKGTASRPGILVEAENSLKRCERGNRV